ncbi:MAG: C25 family cysteine peptidase [Bacteroidota bacterium]
MRNRAGTFRGLLRVLVLLLISGGDAAAALRLLRTEPGGWVFAYEQTPGAVSSVDIGGILHEMFPPPHAGSPGDPLLPVESVCLGIPWGGSLDVSLRDPLYEILEDREVAPVPRHLWTDEGEAVEVYEKDPRAYASGAFFPGKTVEADPPVTIRYQRVATVRLHPVQYKAAARQLRRLVSAELRVRLNGASGLSPGGGPVDDPACEPILRGLLANYEQARAWRRAAGLPMGVRDPSRDWFQTGRTYYRIPVAVDGWRRVTKADLAAAGADPGGIDTASLTLFFNGVQVPVHVLPDSSVEFMGRRNAGDSSWSDPYTDTSAYWLTWGGEAGARFAPVPACPDSAATERTSAGSRAHFETNTGYFTGTTQLEVIQNGPVPGEGWYWERLFPGTSVTRGFRADDPDTSHGHTSVLRVRFFSMTPDSPSVDHQARIWLNDSLLGDALFEGRTGITFADTFPAFWLRSDTNRLRVTSIPTPSVPNLFYLDWCELDYDRFLTASSGQCEFTAAPDPLGSPIRFSVGGFTRPEIGVWDLTHTRRITGGTVEGDSVSGFRILFADTLSAARTYLVATEGAGFPAGSIRSKRFADIRSSQTGADYLVVAYGGFLSAAAELASHRSAAPGVRALVVPVEDIYDEFNYGVTDVGALREFLRYTWEHWPAPAPSSVLLFGDASWDFHAYLPTTVKRNFVPAYGVPAGDNWYGCLDSLNPSLPFFFIGRIPVQDSIQARRTVAKIMAADMTALGEWNKSFMMITGGTTPGEQATFNARTEATIAAYIAGPPVGGTPHRVYKSTQAVIDGEHRQRMRDLVGRGLVFVNFLGHSGGRIWGVDIGSPYDLPNTNGMFPFVSSVSCNVGAFAEPSNNVLAEDFLLADGRGAIGAWASSSLGYPTPGTLMLNYFLDGAAHDTLRFLGALTSAARIRLLLGSPADPVYRAMVNLNPLLGDPLSRLALPLHPDLAVNAGDIAAMSATPTPADSSVTLRVRVHNWGLVPADSVELLLTDTWNGASGLLITGGRMAPPLHHDSLLLPWEALHQPGLHTLDLRLDPRDLIPEEDETNNRTLADIPIYPTTLAPVRPLNGQVTGPGPCLLVASSPVGRDTLGFEYLFELDTLDTFDSPFLVRSGPVAPGPVSGEWTTPPLPEGGVFFWRVRTSEDSVFGSWRVSSFSTGASAPPPPAVRLHEFSPKQFSRMAGSGVAATPGGVTIAPTPPAQLSVRSLGYRANLNRDYYSVIRLNDLTMTGHWWVLGSSFMALRVDAFSGAYDFRAFNVAGQPAQRDTMVRFIQDTPPGNYLAIAVIYDGRTNVHESLYVALESLGSTQIRQVTPGQSWAFIGRRGDPSAALESRTNDSALVSLQIPNVYAAGSGSIRGATIPIPLAWDSLFWSGVHDPPGSLLALALVGERSGGGTDTLGLLAPDSAAGDLGGLTALTAGPTYAGLHLSGLLRTGDARTSPVLRSWGVDFVAPSDLAVSARTIGPPGASIERGTPFSLSVTVHNIGFSGADSAGVIISMYDKQNRARPIAWGMLDSIPPGGARSLSFSLETRDFARRVTLEAAVRPSKKNKDLVAANNTAYYTLLVNGPELGVLHLYADGVRLMEGDYLGNRPALLVRRSAPLPEGGRLTALGLLVNGVSAPPTESIPRRAHAAGRSGATPGDEARFAPELASGRHELTAYAVFLDRWGEADTVREHVGVQVEPAQRILDLYPFPNPFRDRTEFTCILTGAAEPVDLRIRIYTVAGRMIRELAVADGGLRLGFNRIPWDGRDAEGDEIAGGAYLYRVTVRASDGREVQATGKIARLP